MQMFKILSESFFNKCSTCQNSKGVGKIVFRTLSGSGTDCIVAIICLI